MDPATGWAAVGGVVSIIATILGYLKYRRGKNEKLGQAEADELKKSMDRATTGNDPPLTGLRLDK